MLLNILLSFIESLELLEVCECFTTSAKLVVDLKLAANKGKILKGLEVRKILSGVL